MPTTRWNKGVAPVNSDAYNLTADMQKLLDTSNMVVPVSSAAERDALTPPQGKYAGMCVVRTDVAGLPIERWSGTEWVSQALAQIGATTNAGAAVTGTTLNVPLETTVTVDPHRRIRVIAQIEGTADTAGLHIAYFIKAGGTGTDGTVLRSTTKRYNAASLGEGVPQFEGRYSTGAGGAVRFSLQAQVTVTAGTVSHAAGNVTLIVDDMGYAP
jgi:hypothetical protein